METHTTTNPEQTQQLAEKFAQQIVAGGVYAFFGDLGAGKTTFIQGLLRALGAEGPFTSPTFTIVHPYTLAEGTFGYTHGLRRIYHIDAYRIDATTIDTIGWQEMVSDAQASIFVEWPEKIAQCLSAQTQELSFVWQGETVREITLPKRRDFATMK